MFSHHQFLRKIKISTRLTVSLMAMCLLPVLILTGLFYKSYQDTIYDKLSASTKQGLVLYSTILDFQMGKCESISDGIMMDEIVQTALESRNIDELAISPELNAAAMKSFNSLFMWESYMKGFTICGAKGLPVAGMGFVNISQSDLETLFTEFKPEREYKKWIYLYDENNTPCIALCRKIFSAQELGKLLGYVLIYVDPEQLAGAAGTGSALQSDNMLKIIVEDQKDRIVIYDGKSAGIPILEVIPDYSADTVSAKPYMQANVAGNDSIIVAQKQSKTGWYILGVLPKAELDAAMQRIAAPFSAAIICIIMLGMVFSVVIQRSIQKPVEKIIGFTKEVALGDFTKLLNDESNDEISVLSRNVDGMVTQISALFEQNRIIERKRHELELEVLQYQINPHFLFNTLNSFQYIAELNGVKSVSQGISNLCTILKYTLNNQSPLSSLQQEIDIVDAYLKIQQIKFAGRFSANYDIDPVSADALVIHFMLQPIVENSILHGLGDSELHIDIQSEVRAGRLSVIVSDDGKGFDVDLANTNKSRFSGIGLSNVRERLEMQFNGDCAFSVESKTGSGTRTTIELPFIAEQRREPYDAESIDS